MENTENKIILKRGRPKKLITKIPNHVRGRIPEKRDIYIVEYKGIEKKFKTMKEISNEYGISDSSVYKILNNKMKVNDLYIKRIDI